MNISNSITNLIQLCSLIITITITNILIRIITNTILVSSVANNPL